MISFAYEFIVFYNYMYFKMLAGTGSSITGAASTVVRDNLITNVILVSNTKGKIAASPLVISQLK